MSPSAFELQEGETWRAIATDEDAYAWTEIFLEDYGRTPVEVTPAADDSAVADYPGFGSMELERLLSEKDWDMKIPSLAENGTVSAEITDASAFLGLSQTEISEKNGNHELPENLFPIYADASFCRIFPKV